MSRSVLLIGFIPELVDFSKVPGAPPDLNAAKVQAGLDAELAQLRALGYDAQWLLVDLGETAEQVVAQALEERAFACVLIGAGVRLPPVYFATFEKLVNVVHAKAPGAKICFNTMPTDTAAAVQRWLP
jgi:hypothetical protein